MPRRRGDGPATAAAAAYPGGAPAPPPLAPATAAGHTAPAPRARAAGQPGGPPSPAPAAAARRDDKAARRFVENLASALMEMGFPRMPARVFSALLTSDSGRLSAAELGTGLQASPAAVSGAVRYLIQLGMVRREGERGSRRHYYRAPDNVWDEVIGTRDHLMARWTGVMREGVDILGADTPAGARLAESARFFEFVASELPLVISRWRERRASLDGDAGSGR